jgi:tRNA threonylcarbamoyladenosine biosynthesis protein TsaE
MATFTLENRAATLRAGRTLGALLRPGDVIALIGDLGAGKTTLTQGIAQGMGIDLPVTSPTFTLLHEYPGAIPLFHFDPYRLESAEEARDMGLDEYFTRQGVVVVEWADKVLSLLPAERLLIELVFAEEDAGELEGEDTPRRCLVDAVGPRYEQLLEAWLARSAE